MRLSTLNPQPSTRPAFTLIELIIVVLVLLILMTITVAVVGNMLDSDRVRGAGRQIQNYLAGARDRAIYSASRNEGTGVPPRVGVRFQSDPALVDPATGNHRGFSSMVFVQEVAPMRATLRLWPGGTGTWHASQLDPSTTPPTPYDQGNPLVSVEALINRGLVEARLEPGNPNPDDNNDIVAYYLQITLKDDANNKNIYVRFHNSTTFVDNNGWLKTGDLSTAPPPPGNTATGPSDARPIAVDIHLRPAPMPNEEPRLLPENAIVEIQSSLAGGSPQAGSSVPAGRSLRSHLYNGAVDVMFNAQGVVDGPLAADGLLHLVVADLEDIERGFEVVHLNNNGTPADPSDDVLEAGSPYLDQDDDWTNGVTPADSDGDGEPDVRQGDVRIVSLRTRTGNAYVSELNPATNTANRYDDPFRYAEIGGEAR